MGLVALVALVASGAWWSLGAWNATDGAERASRAPGLVLGAPVDPGALGWIPDDRRAYRLSMRVDVTQSAPGTPPSVVETALEGVLALRVLDAGGTTARVALQLGQVRYAVGGTRDAPREAALGVPFVVSFDGGQPSAFEFPEGLDEGTRSRLVEVVRAFQASGPRARAARWTTHETDEVGAHEVTYRVLADGAWRKTKGSYDAAPAGDVQILERVEVFEAVATLSPAVGASWWEAAEVAQDLGLTVLGGTHVRGRMRASLRFLPGVFDPTSELARLDDAQDLLRVPVPDLGRESEQAPRSPTAAEREAFDQLLAAFEAGGGQDHYGMYRLAEMLAQFPELADELPPRLADAELDATVASKLIFALMHAGNERCQLALGEVCTGPDVPFANRLNAVIGLGGVASAGPTSVETLWQLSAEGSRLGTEEAADLANTALLSLGRIGRTLAEADAERHAEVSLRLGNLLQDPASREIALKAISNLRDPSLLPAASLELHAPEPLVRDAAILAVSSMDRPEAFDSLVARLDHEQDPRLRAALVAGMGKLGHTSEPAFARCVELLRTEDDGDVQEQLARYLGERLDLYPEGREALEDLLRDPDTRPNVRVYLTKTLRPVASPRRPDPRG